MKKLLAFTLSALSFVTTSAQTQWDLPSGYAVNTFQVKNLQQFADEVKQFTQGKLVINLHPGGSLYKTNEIKRAVQTGQVPIGEFIISGSANENNLYGVDSIPFLATSYMQSKKLYMASRAVQEKLLADQGMKVLFSVPWPGQSLYSMKPITRAEEFVGTKMRTYNPATTRIAQLLKAQPVTIQLAELGQALATGGVDNFLTSSASGVESKLYEQVKYFYPVSAWLPRNITVVSQKAFDSLDKTTQELVLKAAVTAEARGWAQSEQLNSEYIQELAAQGMQVAGPNDSVKQALTKVGEMMTEEWLKGAGEQGKAILEAYKR